jgi:hypothetical protein
MHTFLHWLAIGGAAAAVFLAFYAWDRIVAPFDGGRGSHYRACAICAACTPQEKAGYKCKWCQQDGRYEHPSK